MKAPVKRRADSHAASVGAIAPIASSPPQEAAFSVTATQSSQTLFALKEGDTFAVLDGRGDMSGLLGSSAGLYHCDTRYLSRFVLLINDTAPLFLGSNLRDDNSALIVDLTNPDFVSGRRLEMEKDTVHILRTIFLWRDTAYQRIAVRNYGDRRIDARLSIFFESDFADLFEVRGSRRERHGRVAATVGGLNRVVFAYDGLDLKLRQTVVTFDPAPQRLGTGSAAYELHLAPGEMQPIFVAVSCNFDEKPPQTFARGLIAARRDMRAATLGMTSVETSDDRFNEMLCRSAADLMILLTDTPQGRYPYAGIPWYSTTFGRDGLITALQMLWWSPDVARGVLHRLAAYQATTTDPFADAEPGKILHEMRGGEMAALREVPFGLYYGSVDSTPLFVLLTGLYAERTGDMETVSALWPAITAALNWIDGAADIDGDGFVEYQRAGDRGLANQGWKDSHDAIFHADGRLAQGPIALAEVQGYVYAAKRVIARCARRLGHDQVAAKLDADATWLAQRFEAAFWCPDIDTYALALDGAKEPCRVRSSNAGQVLFTGIAGAERAGVVAEGLLQPRFFSGWGIRTIAKGESRYNPMSYHNGSIWPHDNALIALGLARFNHKRSLDKLIAGLFDAATYMELRRLPELFCGFERKRGHGPTLYPVACSPQAWASATPFTLIEAALGLQFDPFAGAIRLANPRLPEFLDEVILRQLKLGASRVDLRIRRHDETVSLDILRNTGNVMVSIVHSS
jgi:glycogen debranching enzyme